MRSLNVSRLQLERAPKLTFDPGGSQTFQDRIRRAGGAKIKLPIPIKVRAGKGWRDYQQQGAGSDKQKPWWQKLGRCCGHISVSMELPASLRDGSHLSYAP